MIVNTALMCMALNVYFEARGEQIPGQYAVAIVTRNRAGGTERVCTEVFRPKQFSWANRGVKRVSAGWQIPARLIPKDEFAWWRAQRIAQVVLAGGMPNWMPTATHYHCAWVHPAWRTKLRFETRIGAHRFYSLS